MIISLLLIIRISKFNVVSFIHSSHKFHLSMNSMTSCAENFPPHQKSWELRKLRMFKSFQHIHYVGSLIRFSTCVKCQPNASSSSLKDKVIKVVANKSLMRYDVKYRAFHLTSSRCCRSQSFSLVKGLKRSHPSVIYWRIVPSKSYNILTFFFSNIYIFDLVIDNYYN